MSSNRLDLGSGHWLEYTSWAPDRELNPHLAQYPDVGKWGAIVGHPLRPDDELCAGRGECHAAITFDGEVQRQLSGSEAVWQVQSWDPLTVSPSLLCHCGDHGFIQNGAWVTA
jgi:hypothetical protein